MVEIAISGLAKIIDLKSMTFGSQRYENVESYFQVFIQNKQAKIKLQFMRQCPHHTLTKLPITNIWVNRQPNPTSLKLS
eukprot:scaffold49704_cov50-Cyclotella_meneghiniana.AAC.4